MFGCLGVWGELGVWGVGCLGVWGFGCLGAFYSGQLRLRPSSFSTQAWST